MRRLIAAVLLATLLGACAGAPPAQMPDPSACTAGEATYACQVERYRNVNVP